MPNREPIETTNLDTIYGSPTIPWSRPRDLLGSTISCVNGGNFGNTRSTAARVLDCPALEAERGEVVPARTGVLPERGGVVT